MLSGIVPVKLFNTRSKVFRLESMEKLNLDRSPLNPLRLRLMLLRFVHLLRVDGSSPDMLSFKWISSNLLILPIESGILLCNLFIE